MVLKKRLATKSDIQNSKPYYKLSDNQIVNLKESHEELRVGLQANLSAFLSDFNDTFKCGKRDNSACAHQLVSGLFSGSRGERNLERIVEQQYSGYPSAQYQSLQHFITHSPWSSSRLMSQIALQTSGLFDHWQDTGLIIDEKSHLKKGKQSVGVSKQYAGTVGKTENCQVGVYASLVNGQYSTLSNTKLFLPEQWCKDAQRCNKAKIPKQDRVYKTKQELAAQMVAEAFLQGVKFAWVGGDGLYGHGYELSDFVESLGQNFVFDVHSDQNIYLHKPLVGLPKAKKTGRPLKRKRVLCGSKPIEVREYSQQLTDRDFKKVVIRKTPKGALTYWVHVVKVYTWIAPSYREKGQPEPVERTLIIQKGKGEKPKIKYSLSNINVEQVSVERFAYMQAQRFWVEKSFKDASKDIGMSDYQVRSYNAWYHFQSITMLAMLFALTEKMKNKEYLPLLSYRDIKIIIQAIMIDYSLINIKRIIQQMIYRHQQRQKDIDRYYSKSNVTK